MTFDVEAALRDGYTEDEVADFLAQKNRFDSARARQDGYSAREIIDHLQGQKEVAFDAVTGTTAAMSKDTADPLGAGKTLIAGISRLPSELAATAIQTAKGQSGATVSDKGILDRFLEQNAKDREEFVKQYGSEAQILPGIPISVKDVAELPSNLAFSGTSAVTGLAAGVATALATKSPALAWTAGGAASGTMAYRATANQIMQQYLEAMNETSREKFGRDITPEEEEKLKSKFSNLATAYGLYEAIPEAIGNVAELRIITKPLAKMVGKDLAAEIVKRIMKTYGMELSTETITQIGQQRVESEIGLTDEAPRSFTSPSDIAKSAAEVAPQVFLLTTVMGGAAAGGTAIYRKYSSRKVSQIIQDGAEQAEQIPDDQIDTVIKGAEEVQKRRPNDEKLKESVDVIKKEKKRRTKEAPVEGKAEEVAPYPALPQGFFDDLRTYLVDGKDKNGNLFDIDHVRSFREKYASQPKANPESIRLLDQFLEDMELGNVTKPTEDTTQLMHSLRADAMQGLPMDQIMARGDELKGRHPQLTDEINKLIIEFQGKAIKAPEAAPVAPAVEEIPTPAPTPAQPEIVAPAPAGEAGTPDFDKVDKIVAGMTGTFRDKAEALKAMEKRGEISKAELGHAIMALEPETEKAAPVKKVRDTVQSLLSEHETGNLTVADIAARLSKQEVSPAIQKALDAYEQASAEDRFEYGMRGGLEEEAESALMDVIRAEVKKPTPKPERAEEPNLEEYAGKVVGKDIKSVSLVGSSVKGKGRDIDIVYDFGKVGLPEDTGKASEAVEALLEKQDNIDLDLYDTFIKADGRYFHVSSGAGRAVVENTEYGKAQEGKPVRILAGQKKPPSQEKVSEEVKSLILYDMRTALEEGHKYGMRDDETAGQGSNVTPIGTTNPPWLMDIVREMKKRHQQTIGKAEIQAVIRKELEGKGYTLTPKQLKIWFIIEGHLRNESQNPHYIRAAEVMSGAKDALVDEFSNRLEAGEYDNVFSDLSFPPTEKEIETAAQNVVSKEVANGNEEALQTYTAERSEAHREENEAPAAEVRAEEVTPKTEKTEAGEQGVIPGASFADTFDLTPAEGEIGVSAPATAAGPKTATIEEVAKAVAEKPLSEKSMNELVKDAFSIINDHIKKNQGLSFAGTGILNDELFQKLKPIFVEMARRAKAKAVDVKGYIFGAVNAMEEGTAKDVYEEAAERYVEEESKPKEETPTFNSGDRVTWTGANGEALTGTVKYDLGPGKYAVNTDQIKTVGGVPIGRVETVSGEKLKLVEKAEEPKTPTPEAKPTKDLASELFRGFNLRVTIATTKKGNEVWNVSGNTKEHREAIKAAGGRWYGPKRVWYFNDKEDPTGKLLAALYGKEGIPEAPKEGVAVKEEAKPQLVMGTEVVVHMTANIDGIKYDLFRPKDATDDKRGFVMGTDLESGKVIQVTAYRTFDEAETRYGKLLEDVTKRAEDTPEAPETALTAKEQTAYGKVADFVDSKISSGESFTREELFKAADEAFGGSLAEGKYSAKDAYDSMELGVNKAIGEPSSNAIAEVDPRNSSTTQAIKHVKELKNRTDLLPTQTTRTAEMDEFQQFSTPPAFAYVANWVANIKDGETYLEPSAGTGNLAIFGKIAGARVIVNEISPRRVSVLKELGFARIHTENAEQLNNILPDDVKPTVIVMNPPFSATGGRMQGERKTANGAVHIEQALKRLEPGGRLVAIVGEGMAADKANFKDWWKKIRAEYTVKANIGVSGEEYKKFGTTFDNQLLVIDKTGKTEDNEITGKVSKVEDLIPLLEGVRDARTYPGKQKPSESGLEKGAEEARPAARPNEPVLPATGGVGPGQSVRAPGQQTPKQPGKPARVEPGEGGAVSGTRPERGEARPGAVEQGEGARGVGGSTLTGSSRQPAEANAGIPEVSGLTVEQKLDIEKEVEELSDSVFDAYKPAKLSIPNAKPHPGKLVESAAMASVEPIDPTYQPHLPEKIIKEGKVSLAQLEAVVYAGQAHGEVLPDGTRKGYFIGDGTGVGKGREIAAILWDNFNQGRKKALWISQNSPLIKDAARDIEGVGWDSNLLFDVGKTKLHSDINQTKGIGFVGYGTLKMEKSADGKKVSRLQQIVKWLGEDFDGVIAFDESHNMGNAVAVKGKRGMTKPSATALAGIELQKLLPKARVLYVSATGATEVMNLAYATRLGLWGDKTPFSNAREFVQDISGGGIGIMEMVAQNMKAMGVYTARSLAYDDVKYGFVNHTLTEQQREVYDEMAGAWQGVLRDINAALRLTGVKDADTGRTMNGQAVAAAMSKFWGTNQRFWNQIITAMQMPSVVSAIEKDMQEGHSSVVQLVNTNEAAQERAIARLEEGEELEDLDLTPRDSLMEYVKNSFPVQQFEEYTDDEGNVKSRPVVDSAGNPVENKEAVAMREALLTRLGSIRVPDGPLEILLNHFSTDNVAEVTGRSRRVVYKQTPEGKKRVSESWGKNKGMADADQFMAGKKRILVFSYAGGTGRSYHADLTAKNQQLRKQYLVQAGWRADRAVQGLGRTHRTNQKQAPEWILVTTDLQGQKRFISSIARRLDQLGALTRGERKAGSQGLFSARDNLESQEAREALRQLIVDMHHGDAEMGIGEFENATGLTGLIDPNTGALNESKLPDIAQFLNRILNMKIADQDKVFGMFSYRHDMKVAEAIRRGTLDEGMQTIRAKKTEKIQEQVVYRDEKTKAETKYVEVELTHDAKRMDYAQSRLYADNGYVRNIKSGRVWALGKQKSTTDTSTGEVKLAYVAVGANYNYHNIPVDETNDPTKYEKIPKDKSEKPWNDEFANMPAEVKERVHMVTGAILPIWDRLPGEGQKVYRLNVDGRNIIGRVIPKRYLQETLKSLGAQASKTEYKAPDIFANVLHRGYKYRLSNNWRIERRKVAGDYRIELVGPYYGHMAELGKYGIFEERINYQTRYFIPTKTETGTKAIEEIISSRPVTEEEIPHGARAGEVTEKDIEHDNVKYAPAIDIRDLHRRGLLKPAKIEDVKKFFVGQEVGKDHEGNIYVKTRGGKYVTLYRVEHIEQNAAVILAGYGKTKFAPGSVIPGAFGQKSTGGYYIKLHRTFGDTWTLAHESMHFLETSGIINSLDVSALKAHIKRLHREGKWETANKQDVGGPEDRANFIADRLAVKEQRGPIGRIILRIRAFIDGILESFGIRSPESILRGIESGRVFERTGREGKGTVQFDIASPTDTKAFKDWFGKSKVVDENGEPLVVYHGSATDNIEIFDPARAGEIQRSDWGKGIYFTPARFLADSYRNTAVKNTDNDAQSRWDDFEKAAKSMGTRTMDMWLDLRANKITQTQYDKLLEYEKKWRDALRSAEKQGKGKVYDAYLKIENPFYYTYVGMTDPFLSDYAKDKGHDGIIIKNEAGHIEEIVVFSPTQIKSVNNTGTFSKTNPNIMFEVMTPDLPDFMQQYLDSKAEAVEKEFKPFAFDEKSSKNEGLFQLHPSKEFKDFRRVDSWYGVPLTDGVYFVVGTREGYREPQAIRFNKAKFTEAQAKDWWERHKKQFSTVNLFRPKAIEMPAFEPGKVNDWLNNETELNVQHILKREKDLAKKTAGRMKPSNLPHNTWLENMLKSFEWMEHPVLSRIVKIMMSTRSELYHENFNFMTDNKVIEETRALRRKGLSRMDRAMGKTSEEYQLLGKMIDYLDLHWKRNKKQTREEQLKAQEEWMKANGATADIIKVWKLHRESYDKGLDLMTAQMRGMIRELDDRAKATGEDVSKLKQTLEYHLAQMDEWKGSYAPRVRSRGSWWVWAHRGEGEKKEYVMDFRGSSMAADRLASKLKEQGWTVSRVEESKQLPEEIQQQIKTVAVSRAIEKALEDMKRNVKGNSDLILKFHEELLENVADEIKARGFRSSMIHRNTDKIVKGYKEDPLERLVIYTNNTSSGLAKATSAKMATNELFGEKDEETGERIGGIDPVKDKRTFATAQLYMEEQLRNADQTDRLIAIAKAIATFKYLGLNLRSAFVNTTALATTAPPAIQQYALDGKVGFHKIMNALAAASKDCAIVMAGGKLSNPEEQAFLDKEKRLGWDDAQYTREAMGSIQRTQHRALSLAMDASMYVFGKTEQWNRKTTMLAAYRLARKQGFSPDEAADRAHEASNKAHGIYGKATMPSWAMGRNPLAKVGQLAYVYAKFGHNYLQMLYDLGMKKKNIGAFTYAMLAPLVVGGMAAFPFREQLFAMAGFILRALFGEDRDPEKWVWDQIRKQFGSTGEAIGRHGITGYLGLDISSSLSIGVGIPKGLGDLAGPAGGVVEDVSEAWRYGKQGQGWRTAEKIAPRALENPIKALREAREGAVTKHGYRVWDEEGKPFMPTDLEATSRAFGFRSTRQAVISERTNEAKREMKSFDDRKDAIYERYRAYLASEKKDPAEHRAITQKVREYNEGLRKAGISKDEVPRITFESMRRQAQRMRKPTKQQKAMLD